MRSLIERFMEKVSPEPNSGCWLWTAYVNKFGYGRFQVKDKSRAAHRVSYEIFVGQIPEGLDLDHLCRVRCCVNPDHLEAVTRQVNVLRGLSPLHAGDKNLAKTHCPNGHPYSGKNLAVNLSGAQSGARRCRACKSIQHKKWYQRHGRHQDRSAIRCHF